MREIVRPFSNAVVVHSKVEARKLLRKIGERQWPGCWVADGPVPGEPPFCQSPRELIRIAFRALTPQTPDK